MTKARATAYDIVVAIEACPHPQPAHRVRIGAVPEHRRVLEPQDSDFMMRQYLHAPLRILRSAQGPS